MNGNILLFACAAALASCDKGPEINLKNATGNQIVSAVSQPQFSSSASFIEPGEWQSRVKIEQMDFPGMRPEVEARMKQALMTDKDDPTNHCVTAAEVNKPKADFFAAEKSCTYDHFVMGGGQIDIAMTCHREDGTQTRTVAGTYTPTTYSVDIESRSTSGRRAGAVIKVHADAQRVGECTGKNDD